MNKKKSSLTDILLVCIILNLYLSQVERISVIRIYDYVRHKLASASVGSVSTSLAVVMRLIVSTGTFLRGKKCPSSTDSSRASCQLLAIECALNTGKLSPGGLPMNSAVYLLINFHTNGPENLTPGPGLYLMLLCMYIAPNLLKVLK